MREELPPEAVRARHLPGLSYTRGVMREAMRLYPVAPFLTRIAPAQFLLGGHTILPGDLLLLSSYAMAGDPGVFARPDEVLPERWMRTSGLTETERTRQARASTPFGHGTRGCIGESSPHL